MDNMSFVYNINICRICQIPNNLDLVNTSNSLDNGKTYMDLLKFIFKDIPWIEDCFISLICHICIKNIKHVAEFKSICVESNNRRGAINNVVHIKLETELNDTAAEVEGVGNSDNYEPEVETMLDGETSEVEQLFVKFEEEQNSTDIGQNNECLRKSKRKRKETIEKPPKNDSEVEPNDKKLEKAQAKRRATPKLYYCDLCSMQLRHIEEFDRHMYKHNGVRKYVCTVCGKASITKEDLKSHHKMVHTNREDHKYLCTECGMKFKQIGALKTHKLRRHSNIRDFKCDICGKDFAKKHDLQDHLLSHSKVRAFKCHLCPAEYKRRDALFNHKSKHHGIGHHKFPVQKMVSCTFCDKIVRKDKLARHIRTHTGAKPYSCRLCGSKFTCNSYIRGHVKTKHKIDITADKFDVKLYYDVSEETTLEDDGTIRSIIGENVKIKSE